uniref:Uncharacterized protein n=1 Tax=Curvibacter symbiont subsp. Hydra magnipapillata TaxID=667019 RepID=C9Y959_CURXX|nr:hypothetical protein Csp_A06600 [Curvibacter putative symbiont of Hydra magnipapillata]
MDPILKKVGVDTNCLQKDILSNIGLECQEEYGVRSTY